MLLHSGKIYNNLDNVVKAISKLMHELKNVLNNNNLNKCKQNQFIDCFTDYEPKLFKLLFRIL